jgi:hypothetical protein
MATTSGKPSPPNPSKSQMKGRLVWAGVAVAVAVIAIVAVVEVTKPPSPKVGSFTDFLSEQSAVATAAPLAAKISGGPWNVSTANGYVGGPASYLTGQLPPPEFDCTIHNGTVTNPPAPASTEGYYLGLSAAWIVEYLDPSGNATLELLVENGTAGEMAEWSGTHCQPDPLLGSVLVDSTTAAAAVNATSSGAAWIKLNPLADAIYTLEDTPYHSNGAREVAAIWTVSYTSTESDFGAEVFANNGTVVCVSTSGC